MVKNDASNTNLPYVNKQANINNKNNAIKNNSYISENDGSSSIFHLNHQQSIKKINLIKNDNEKISINSKNAANKIIARNSNNLLENYSNIISNESFNKTINNININIRNSPDNEYSKKNRSNNRQQNNKFSIKKDKKNSKEKIYVMQKLFPFKYYFYSIFIKNISFKNNKSYFFPKKFLSVYNFICQILDISSYLILQKEFQTIKSTLMKGKYRDLIENRQKINVNDQTFNIDMKECLDDHKLSILGKIKKNTDNS
jgi:hypothetical protein